MKIKGLRWWIIGLVALGTAINYLARSSLSVAASTLFTELHITEQQYSWVIMSFQMAYTLAQSVCGYILDSIGLRIGFFIFALAWSFANMAHALAINWQSLAFCRGLLGLSESAAIPAGIKSHIGMVSFERARHRRRFIQYWDIPRRDAGATDCGMGDYLYALAVRLYFHRFIRTYLCLFMAVFISPTRKT